MQKSIVAVLIACAVSTAAFAHKGEAHSYMGMITKSQAGGTFVMRTTAGKTVSFTTSTTTTYTYADNKPAKESALQPGARVVVKISKDGKTATSIKIAPREEVK